MKIKFRHYITAICIAFMSFTAQAQSKVAHINLEELVRSMPEFQTNMSELEKIAKDYEIELENLNKEYIAKRQDYAADEQNQTRVTNANRAQELADMENRIIQYRQTINQDLQNKNFELMKPVYEKANAAIDKIASSQGFDYVLNSQQGGPILISKGKDLMADVKIELGF
jgi:outer membrane protein